MNIVLSILKLLDYLANQYDNQFRNAVKILFANMQTQIDLAVEGIKADVYEAFYFKLAKEMTQRPVLVRLTCLAMTSCPELLGVILIKVVGVIPSKTITIRPRPRHD